MRRQARQFTYRPLKAPKKNLPVRLLNQRIPVCAIQLIFPGWGQLQGKQLQGKHLGGKILWFSSVFKRITRQHYYQKPHINVKVLPISTGAQPFNWKDAFRRKSVTPAKSNLLMAMSWNWAAVRHFSPIVGPDPRS